MNLYVDPTVALLFGLSVAILSLAYGAHRLCRLTLPLRDRKIVAASAIGIRGAGVVITSPPIDMFDKDVVVRTITELDDMLASTIAAACREAAATNATLQVEINTSGGDTVIGRSVAGILQAFARRYDLRIVVTGKCYSAGMVILMAADPSCRYAVSGSEFLIHAARFSADGKRADRTRAVDDVVRQIIVDGTKIDNARLAKHLKSGKDCYFSAEDAVRMGVVGAII